MADKETKYDIVGEIEILLDPKLRWASTNLWKTDRPTLIKIRDALRERKRLKE